MADIRQTVSSDLGAGHFMESDITLHDNGHIDGKTRTRTVTWLGGFTGGVSMVLFDQADVAIGQSWEHTFGVDGSWFGRRDRTDYWGEDIDPGVAHRTTRFEILHYWAPKWGALNNIVAHAVQIGQTAEPLLKQLRDNGIIGK